MEGMIITKVLMSSSTQMRINATSSLVIMVVLGQFVLGKEWTSVGR
jgi:hypothetical protein